MNQRGIALARFRQIHRVFDVERIMGVEPIKNTLKTLEIATFLRAVCKFICKSVELLHF